MRVTSYSLPRSATVIPLTIAIWIAPNVASAMGLGDGQGRTLAAAAALLYLSIFQIASFYFVRSFLVDTSKSLWEYKYLAIFTSILFLIYVFSNYQVRHDLLTHPKEAGSFILFLLPFLFTWIILGLKKAIRINWHNKWLIRLLFAEQGIAVAASLSLLTPLFWALSLIALPLFILVAEVICCLNVRIHRLVLVCFIAFAIYGFIDITKQGYAIVGESSKDGEILKYWMIWCVLYVVSLGGRLCQIGYFRFTHRLLKTG